MKSFIWRLKSNMFAFMLICIGFTAAFLTYYYANLRVITGGYIIADNFLFIGYKNYKATFNPLILGVICLAVFFLYYTKRYTPHQDYFLGFNRTDSYLSNLGCAVLYSVLFAMYALSVAVFTRIGLYCGGWADQTGYTIPFYDFAMSFLILFSFGMLMYGAANSLRMFRSFRFICGEILCLGLLILLYRYSENLFYAPGNPARSIELGETWGTLFYLFGPVMAAYLIFDFIMTRGRQRR